MSRNEDLLNALLNGETVDFEPMSRVESYLKACCEKSGCEGLPEPISRIDELLYELAEKIAEGGGGDDEEPEEPNEENIGDENGLN